MNKSNRFSRISNYILLLLLISISNLYCQVPIGQDIIGPNANDQIGWAVDMTADGSRYVVSAPLYNNTINDEGLVRVYELINGIWSQMGNDIFGISSYEQCGNAVAINANGTRIILGSHRSSLNGTHKGHARVFEWNGTNWIQMGATIFGQFSQDYAGSSVAIDSDGNTIAIGSPYNDNNGSVAGQVRLYEWSGTQWDQKGSFLHGDDEYNNFGNEITFNDEGDRIAIAAIGHDTPANEAGQIKIFEWTGADWSQMGTSINGDYEYFNLGGAIAMNAAGTKIAAMAGAGFSSNLRLVRTYEWNGSNWVQFGNDIEADQENDRFADSISLDYEGDRLAMGAESHDGNGMDSGHVRIFDYDGASWNLYGAAIFGDNAYDSFGDAVSLNGAGTQLAVGARGFDNGNGYGLLRVFDLTILNIQEIDFVNNQFNIVPNPVVDHVQIINSQRLHISSAELYDSSGKLVTTYEVQTNLSNIKLNVTDCSRGIYSLVIYAGDKKANYRLIKY